MTLVIHNIGQLATPLGSAARSGKAQGEICLLKDAFVVVEDGNIAQVGTGAAPQNVIGSLVADPLERNGMKMTDIDLNQIPYDYTVEVRNTLKGLDLIECLKSYGQRFLTLYKRQ